MCRISAPSTEGGSEDAENVTDRAAAGANSGLAVETQMRGWAQQAQSLQSGAQLPSSSSSAQLCSSHCGPLSSGNTNEPANRSSSVGAWRVRRKLVLSYTRELK